eukprot:CAMPEP_0194140468 /NCGR_PEP_ID=MMETSP0152-20130528/9999_1 /TAXON_ID=1049557 /ORGANISM="Thalassiothrix antarctica, Strain L6-D1" /LENGTH=666 /DNA_ID=CAMNT_0038838721 /DNA_START=60 /DNA_END=2060 /DNA_ORIENTATION=-
MCEITAVDIESPEGNTGSTRSFYLRWSRVSKSVLVKESSSGLLRGSIGRKSNTSDRSWRSSVATKTILNEVSGSAKPGEIVAVMGPSGSGKTSLLNVLSGRAAYDCGVISVNGEPLKEQSRKKLMSKIAYVKQSDIFFEELSVRDQLTYTALLRLPSSFSKEKKLNEVEKLIDQLRLNKVADSPIMLCSGGEKKRVNIATELLTDPLILILDEPTSGLDSTSAFSLMELLRKMCRSQGKTIVTSIHQPSSSVFHSFDKLMMMAEGNVVYFGTPKESIAYLRSINFRIPEGYNAADYWMDLLVKDSMEGVDTVGDTDNGLEVTEKSSTSDGKVAEEIKPRQILIDSWDGEDIANKLDAENNDESDGEGDQIDTTKVFDEVKKYNTSWFTQFRVLMHRCLKNTRSKIFTPVNIFKSIAIGLVVGLLWFQVEKTERNVRDISSYFFFTMTYWVFDSMFNALYAFPSERTIVLKERASASYRLSAYFLAKTMSEAPTRLILPLLYMIVSFWMTGISSDFSVFVATTACCLLCVFAGEAVGLMFGAIMYDLNNALAAMTVFSLFCMLLGGFFVQNVPKFLMWCQYISPFKYAYEAAQHVIFNENIPCDGSGVLEDICSGSDVGYATPEQIKDFFRVRDPLMLNVAMLAVISLIPRYIAYLALRAKKGGDRE